MVLDDVDDEAVLAVLERVEQTRAPQEPQFRFGTSSLSTLPAAGDASRFGGGTDVDDPRSWEGKQGKLSVLDARASDEDGAIFSGGMEVLSAGESDEARKADHQFRKSWDRDRAPGDEEMIFQDADDDHKPAAFGAPK
ncbi:hypothetical protein ACA910_007618 [Epithemia clementina (nom. ined.)]